jgi:hypothetical protein
MLTIKTQDKKPKVVSDAVQVKNVGVFNEFFSNSGIQTALHVMDAVAERLDDDFMMTHKLLRQKVCSKPYGGFLRANPSACPGLALHFNQMPLDVHFDNKSLHSGWDRVNPWGPFEDGVLVFPDLGFYIHVRRGDMVFLRGAALRHGARAWKGRGRMVLVPFVDRRLFGAMQVKRPQTFQRLYGSQYKHLRNCFPSKSLASLLPT